MTPNKFAFQVVKMLEQLSDDDESYRFVPNIFQTLDAPAQVKNDAFFLLDEKPGLFPRYLTSHWFRIFRKASNNLETRNKLDSLFN
jgi:hypothetical protein